MPQEKDAEVDGGPVNQGNAQSQLPDTQHLRRQRLETTRYTLRSSPTYPFYPSKTGTSLPVGSVCFDPLQKEWQKEKPSGCNLEWTFQQWSTLYHLLQSCDPSISMPHFTRKDKKR